MLGTSEEGAQVTPVTVVQEFNDKLELIYVANCSFELREIPKAAGFLWDTSRRRWWTKFKSIADRIKDVSDEDVQKIRDQEALTRAEQERALVESRAEDSDVDLIEPEYHSYFGYQRAGIAWGLARQGSLIGDDMGLGKTIQGIGIINNDLSIQRVLITCPAFLRIMWKDKLVGRKDEFAHEEPWLTRPMRVQIIESSDDVIDTRANIIICSYTMMKALHEKLSKFKFDLHICDEAHYCARASTDMTVYTFGGTTSYTSPGETKSHKIKVFGPKATRRVALTGTPMRGGPRDIFTIIHWLDPKAWPSYGAFSKRFVGARNEKNLPELQRILRSTLMIRRLKTDVLKDLPAKLRQVIEFDVESDEVSAALAEDKRRFDASTAKIIELAINKEFAKASEDPLDYAAAAKALSYTMKVAFEEMSKVRHQLALTKIPFVIRHVEELLATGNKVVVFCYHKDLVEQIAAAFKGQSCFITGDTPMPRRREIELTFQGDPAIKLLVGNIDAAGVGLTLTESSNVVMAELDWTPSKVSQAEDRCHRYGQQDSVLVQHLVLTGSTDARMAHVMVEKQDRIDAALNTNTDPDAEMRIRASAGGIITPVQGASSDIARTDIAEMATSSFATSESILAAKAEIDRVIARTDVSAIDRGVLSRLELVPTLSARQAALATVIASKYPA